MLRWPGPVATTLLVALFAALIVLPFFAGPYAVKLATRVLVFGIFVLSLDLLIGITGLVSFGHAAFFALGAYAVYFVSPEYAAGNAALALAAGVGLAAAAALVIGAFAVLTRGFYFIMVTFAAGEMTYSFFFDTDVAGGSDGAFVYVKPALAFGETTILNFADRTAFYYVCLAALLLSYLLLVALARTPAGRVLQAIRWNESRVGALGFNTYAFKLASFVVAAAFAGLAGTLFASIDGYISPALAGWRESGLAIMMVVLGGVGTLYGPILGAFAYAGIEEVLRSENLVGALVSEHWPLFLGLVLIAAVLAGPRGLAGLLERPHRAPAIAPPSGEVMRPRRPERAKSLEVEGLTRRFGGLVAVDGVSLTFAPNLVHAIIGPNGAGKTTFINLLSGALKPSGGRVRLEGEDITGMPMHVIARRGVGRSFQRTNIVPTFTVRENCRLAAQAPHPSPFRLTGGAHAAEEAAAVAYALSVAGLASPGDHIANELSHGEQRQLEIAMLLASGAKLLILDEPLAGMGPEETQRVTSLLRDLAKDHTIILIEHDMDAVFAAADTLSVLVEGRLIAHGRPDDIRRDPAVREAYLGSYGRDEAAE